MQAMVFSYQEKLDNWWVGSQLDLSYSLVWMSVGWGQLRRTTEIAQEISNTLCISRKWRRNWKQLIQRDWIEIGIEKNELKTFENWIEENELKDIE